MKYYTKINARKTDKELVTELAKKFTQKELGKILGISERTIRRIKNSDHKPNKKTSKILRQKAAKKTKLTKPTFKYKSGYEKIVKNTDRLIITIKYEFYSKKTGDKLGDGYRSSPRPITGLEYKTLFDEYVEELISVIKKVGLESGFIVKIIWVRVKLLKSAI